MVPIMENKNNTSCTCVIGDFNSVIRESQRRGSGTTFGRTYVEVFDEFIRDAGLIDLSLHGRSFTWYKPDGSCKSRIDKFMINNEWNKWNEMTGIMISSKWKEEVDEVKKRVYEFFRNHFRSRENQNISLCPDFATRKTREEDNRMLMAAFTEEEVKEADRGVDVGTPETLLDHVTASLPGWHCSFLSLGVQVQHERSHRENLQVERLDLPSLDEEDRMIVDVDSSIQDGTIASLRGSSDGCLTEIRELLKLSLLPSLIDE
ncbi:hypothetical protein ACS0TY_010563 [Phlomoides rotata]